MLYFHDNYHLVGVGLSCSHGDGHVLPAGCVCRVLLPVSLLLVYQPIPVADIKVSSIWLSPDTDLLPSAVTYQEVDFSGYSLKADPTRKTVCGSVNSRCPRSVRLRTLTGRTTKRCDDKSQVAKSVQPILLKSSVEIKNECEGRSPLKQPGIDFIL